LALEISAHASLPAAIDRLVPSFSAGALAILAHHLPLR